MYRILLEMRGFLLWMGRISLGVEEGIGLFNRMFTTKHIFTNTTKTPFFHYQIYYDAPSN